MKITHNKVGQNLNLSDSARADKTDKADGSRGAKKLDAPSLLGNIGQDSAKVELSDRGMEAKKIKELAMAAPDVDEAKVAKFRQLIDDGKYKVDAQAVADRMVDEHLMTSN